MTWAFLHRWFMPFAWIALSSLIAAPAAAYLEHGMILHQGTEVGLAYGSGWALRDDVLASMTPYLLHLGAAIWLFNASGTTRWAAFWALLVGAARIIAAVALAVMSDVPVAGDIHYVDWHTLRFMVWFQDGQMFVLGLLCWAAFANFLDRREHAPSPSHYYAEA